MLTLTKNIMFDVAVAATAATWLDLFCYCLKQVLDGLVVYRINKHVTVCILVKTFV